MAAKSSDAFEHRGAVLNGREAAGPRASRAGHFDEMGITPHARPSTAACNGPSSMTSCTAARSSTPNGPGSRSTSAPRPPTACSTRAPARTRSPNCAASSTSSRTTRKPPRRVDPAQPLPHQRTAPGPRRAGRPRRTSRRTPAGAGLPRSSYGGAAGRSPRGRRPILRQLRRVKGGANTPRWVYGSPVIRLTRLSPGGARTHGAGSLRRRPGPRPTPRLAAGTCNCSYGR